MRLRHSNASGRGYRRVRAGTGFSYRDLDGSTLPPGPVRDRLESIGIPPAWTDVWIAPFDNGHIQATGLDAVGRRQYIYHPEWRERKDRVKFDRALQLAESLPTARRLVTLDLRSDGVTRQRVLAAAFRMLDTGSLRVGSERYTNENGSHGLATLLCAHVHVRKDCLHLSFPAKSGKTWESLIADPDLAAVVRQLKRRGANARLLAYKEWPDVAPRHQCRHQRLRQGTHRRGLHREGLPDPARHRRGRRQPGPERAAEHGGRPRKRAISRAMVEAAAVLGNTPSIARKSYVDPRLLDHFAAGETIDPKRLDSAESELRALLYREGDVVPLRKSG